VLLVAVVGALWLAGTAAPPALDAAGFDRAAGWVRLAYAPLCHQIEGRCFALAGGPLAVCTRCSGLYAGGLAGLFAAVALLAWRRRTVAWLFFAAVAPTVAQWISVRLGAPEPGDLFRFVVSLPAGFACGWFLAHALGELVEGAGSIRAAASARVSGQRPGS
jgi:uncharacterized membrane protein